MRSFGLSVFGRHAGGLFVEAPWGLVLVDPRDGHVSRQFLRTGQYNPEEVNFLLGVLKESDQVLIVGGHIGGLAIPLSRHVQSLNVVEASPANHRLLVGNVALAGATNMTVHHWAASDEEGELEFLVSSENSGGSKRSPAVRQANYYYDKPAVIKVPAYRLDAKFSGYFDAVLMDIEGSEYFAIKGAKRLIKNSRVFIFEFVPDHLRNVAGVNVDQFVSALPLEHFRYAIFPRQHMKICISSLREELVRLYEQNAYEDGVLLTK